MSIFDAEFMRLAFAAGAIVGALAPVVGFFLVQRRMSLIGDGIGHVAFAGVAAGYLLGISPVLTALVASVLGATAIEWLRAHRVMISAAGALNADLFSFLFGSILTVSRSDLLLIASLGAVALSAIAVAFRALVAVVLDEEGARVSGVPVGFLNGLVAGIAAVTIAMSMRIVGILLIAALMVLPVIAASRIAWSVRSTVLLAMAIGIVSVFVGLAISYYANLAPGGAIVLVAAGAFVLATAASTTRGRLR